MKIRMPNDFERDMREQLSAKMPLPLVNLMARGLWAGITLSTMAMRDIGQLTEPLRATALKEWTDQIDEKSNAELAELARKLPEDPELTRDFVHTIGQIARRMNEEIKRRRANEELDRKLDGEAPKC
jgi:hypothetical protein